MAAFENKTIAEIRELIINAIQTAFNKTFRLLPKSFIKVIASVFAGVYIILHKQIGWLFLQLFPETAYWGTANILGVKVRPLVKWGMMIGAGEPRNGSQWKGTITVSVLHTGTLAAGTQLTGDIIGKLYITEQGAALDGDTVTVPVICADTGTAGNLERGDTLSFVSPLGTVQKTAVVCGVTSYAVEDETEAEYRVRVANRFRSPPMGGALSDYRMWASDVPGVLNTYPYKDVNTPSGVLLFVAGVPSLFPERIPTPDLLRQVGCSCTFDPETGKATRKPITAVLDPDYDGSYRNVKPVCIMTFDVYIENVYGIPVSDFGTIVNTAVKNYLHEREPYVRGLSDDNNKKNVVSKNSVLSVVEQVSLSVKAEFKDVIVYREGFIIASYILNMGELAALGKLYINGMLYE